jgi:type I restriction enzyme S subunit
MSAGLRAGYQQTEVGVIPEDWDVTPLGFQVQITSGESPSLIKFTTSGKPYFKVEQLGNCEKYLGGESTPYHFRVGKTVRGNSVIFAKRGAAISLNRVRILSEDSFMDTNLMALTCLGDLDPEFLYYGLGYIGLWQFADVTSVPQINNKHVKPLCFPLPPLPEQRAIAAALSDVDALVGGLDRLIAKKQGLKVAAMQQLLTGQTRLPGFSGEWEVKSLGSVLRKGRLGGNYGNQDEEAELPLMKMGNISRGYIDLSKVQFIVPSVKPESIHRLVYGDVLFNTRNTLDLVGKVAIWRDELPMAYYNSNLMRLEFDAEEICSNEYANYALNTESMVSRLREMATGTTSVAAIYTRDLMKLMMLVPQLPEQTAIAAVLSDMDTELAALQARRSKTQALKQAMMQELLTGRIRLV